MALAIDCRSRGGERTEQGLHRSEPGVAEKSSGLQRIDVLQSDREAPSAVTIITAEQIHQFGYRTLADALRSVRGFEITYDRNYDYVGVRGFSRPGGYNDQVLLLINRHRMNDNVYNFGTAGHRVSP